MSKPLKPRQSSAELWASECRLGAIETRKDRARRILDGTPGKPLEMLKAGEKTVVRVMIETSPTERPLTMARKIIFKRSGALPLDKSFRPLTPTQKREADLKRAATLKDAMSEVAKLIASMKRDNIGFRFSDLLPDTRQLNRELLGPLLAELRRGVKYDGINPALCEDGIALLWDLKKFNAYQMLVRALCDEKVELEVHRAINAGMKILKANAASLEDDKENTLLSQDTVKSFLKLYAQQTGPHKVRNAIAAFDKQQERHTNPLDRIKPPSERNARRWVALAKKTHGQ